MKNLLKMSDLSPAELTHILDVADQRKADCKAGRTEPLMVGIEFFGGIQAADVLAACREKGLLVLTAKSRLRLLPPLTLTAHDVEKALGILNEVLTEMEQKAPKEQA